MKWEIEKIFEADSWISMIKWVLSFQHFFSEPTEGLTALHIAARANEESLVRTLVEHGAKGNVVDSLGRTPFMLCTELGHIESLRLLLEICDGVDLSGKLFQVYHCTPGSWKSREFLKWKITAEIPLPISGSYSSGSSSVLCCKSFLE